MGAGVRLMLLVMIVLTILLTACQGVKEANEFCALAMENPFAKQHATYDGVVLCCIRFTTNYMIECETFEMEEARVL